MTRNIYCGPVLRKVDQQSVNIWLALRHVADLQAVLYHKGEKISCDLLCDKIQAAPSLHVYLLTLSPADAPFPQDELLNYDIFIDGESALSGGELSYDCRNPLPSFVIGQPSPFLSGSCRKIHSEADDMLVYADELLAKRWCDAIQRPKALFLTGDQIYADDVDEDVLIACREVALELFDENYYENFPPLEAGDEASRLMLKNPGGQSNNFRRWYDLGQWEREQFAKDINFTSMKADNHLVLYAEYLALYV